jgi:hypothetical protein
MEIEKSRSASWSTNHGNGSIEFTATVRECDSDQSWTIGFGDSQGRITTHHLSRQRLEELGEFLEFILADTI